MKIERKHTASLLRESTGTTFHHTLTAVEVELLDEREELLHNILEHENPGFKVTGTYLWVS